MKKNLVILMTFAIGFMANCSVSDGIPTEPVKLVTRFIKATENGDCDWIVMYQKEVQKRHPKSDLAVTTEKCQELLRRNDLGPNSKKAPMERIGIEKSTITEDKADIQMSVIRKGNIADSKHLTFSKEDGMWVLEF